MIYPKNIGTDKASEKIKQYCTYQERCHQETAKKLYSFGLYPQEVNRLLAMLIEENYLNEESFAIAYAGGKFRINNWGKSKIKLALKQKQLSDYCIKKGLASIDEDAYLGKLLKLSETKWLLLKNEKNIFVKKYKLQQYLLQKGFESSSITDCINQIKDGK